MVLYIPRLVFVEHRPITNARTSTLPSVLEMSLLLFFLAL